MNFNKFACSVGFIAISTMAYAADIAQVNKATAVGSATVNRWDGYYVGGYVGAQQSKSNTSVDGWTNRNPVQRCWTNEETGKEYCRNVHNEFVSTSYPGASTDGNVIGIMVGVFGGYNKQFNNAIVAGIELDGGWSGARDNVLIYNVNATHKMPWNFNLTGRLGFLVTPSMDTLLYVKAGLAVLEQKSDLSGNGFTASESKTKAGWTAGLGVEHKINARLSARVEGMFTKVSDQTISIPGATTTLNGGSWNAKAGLSWSFN